MKERLRVRGLRLALEGASDELDVPASKYEDAKARYVAVGNYLGEESPLADYDIQIQPQGSFSLGTAIKPPSGCEYDVDAVCLLRNAPTGLTPKALKELVGERLLRPGGRYSEMVDPREGGRRCWTIRYADSSSFHLDVLPAIPDTDFVTAIESFTNVPSSWLRHAIRITDNLAPEYSFGWPSFRLPFTDPTRSNPLGYREFFRKQMEVKLLVEKSLVANQKQADVQEIEDFEVRTPLQRLVQLLKRHRDNHYSGDPDRPISIIITTLAALAYQNESDLAEAMLNVVPRMRGLIECRDGVFWVANPVNPLENFADKWAEVPRKAQVFHAWLEKVEHDHSAILTDSGFEKIGSIIEKSYGTQTSHAAMQRLAEHRGEFQGAKAPILLIPPKTDFASSVTHSPAIKASPWGV